MGETAAFLLCRLQNGVLTFQLDFKSLRADKRPKLTALLNARVLSQGRVAEDRRER